MKAPHRIPSNALVLIALAWLALLVFTSTDLGFARDEGFYFSAARSYAQWFELLATKPSQALAPGVVDAAWSANHEHPSLVKSLFAISWLFSLQLAIRVLLPF